MLNVKDQVVLIAGATSPLGRSLARALVKGGATVYVADRCLDAAARLAVALGPGAHSLLLRPEVETDWAVARASVVGIHGRLHSFLYCGV